MLTAAQAPVDHGERKRPTIRGHTRDHGRIGSWGGLRPQDRRARQPPAAALRNRDVHDRSGRRVRARGPSGLSVQHEYGIFGGRAGGRVLELLRAVQTPVVTTACVTPRPGASTASASPSSSAIVRTCACSAATSGCSAHPRQGRRHVLRRRRQLHRARDRQRTPLPPLARRARPPLGVSGHFVGSATWPANSTVFVGWSTMAKKNGRSTRSV